MVHQVPPDLVGAVGHPVRRRLALRVEEEPRRLDGVRGDDEHLAGRPALAAVPALEADRAHLAVGADLDEHRRGRLVQHRARRRPPVDMHGRVVLRLDRADRDAARIAAARRPVLAGLRVPALRRRADVVDRPVERLEDRPCRDRSAGSPASDRAWSAASRDRLPSRRRRRSRPRPRRRTARGRHRRSASRRPGRRAS